jgi:hypothetical protein
MYELEIPAGTTSQQLAKQIDDHKNAIALAELGMLKMSARKLNQSKRYVKALHKALMDMNPIDEETAAMSDDELLASLGI